MSKQLTKFRPMVRSRHNTHNILRNELPLLPFRSVVRLGSTTLLRDTFSAGGTRIECNNIAAIKISSHKALMKTAFDKAGVITAAWLSPSEVESDTIIEWAEQKYPIIAKHIRGSRGTGLYLLEDRKQLQAWLKSKDAASYIIEEYHSYTREYRLHITNKGCFYTCRKLIKNDTPDNQRFYRNDSNCTWVLEDNTAFNKPVNWDAVVTESIKALNAVGLDMGAVDVKIQGSETESGKKRKEPKFIIIEINSAPSFGDITAQKYLKEIPEVLKSKHSKANA